MHKRTRLILLAALLAAAVGSTYAVRSGSAAQLSPVAVAGSDAKATAVKTSLATKKNEFALIPAVRKVEPGAVVFVVRNGGKVEHEFVVIKTNRPAAKLPAKGGKAIETGAVGEIGSVKPGQTKRLKLTLKPGHYALICNLPGHYLAGQYADFTVSGKSAPSESNPQPEPKPKPAAPTKAATTGEAAWMKAGCGGCHTLAAAGASGTAGPSLDKSTKTLGEIVDVITYGSEYGGAMPAFKGKLTASEIRLIAEYVVRVRKS